MVGSQYESDLAQLHNVFTQSLDSYNAEQVQANTMYVQGQVPVRNGNAMANNTNANQEYKFKYEQVHMEIQTQMSAM